MENWKPLKNTNYLVSDKGRVYSKRSSKVLTPQVNQYGYHQLTLYIDGAKINKRVHRLVAEVFLGESNGLQVNHINGIKTDNSIENLEYVTSKQNHEHAISTGLMPLGSLRPGAKLTEDDVVLIKKLMLNDLDDQEISELTGTVTATISKIRHGKRWTHVMPDVVLPDRSEGTKGNSRGKRKISAEDIPVIRSMYSEGKSLAEIGRTFKVHSGTIHAIVSGKTWKNY
jgi:hypothetical protein